VKRLLPDTIAGWVIVVLISGLALSQLATVAVNYRTRTSAAAVLDHLRIAERMADVVRLVGSAPAEQRPKMLASLTSTTLRVSWGDRPAIADIPAGHWRAQLFSEIVQTALWDVPWRELRGTLAGAPELATGAGKPRPLNRMHEMTPGVARSFDEIMAQHEQASVLLVSIQLDDGSWLSFEAPFVAQGNVTPPWSVPLLVLAGLLIVAASVWAVRRLTAPLATLARAAEQLGHDVNAPPLPEQGPRELRDAAHAFNTMQSRLQRFVRDRTLMVAAMSHDLRTPITRLRLRAEFVDDDEQRRKMLADLDDMESMVGSTLAFMREEASTEGVVSVDLVSLVGNVCEDRAGVTFETGPDMPIRLPYSCRPGSLARCISNVVENAVNYGTVARVRLIEDDTNITIEVDDDGPGIREADRDRVFEPFVRLEDSRNRDTGGTGLGLAIARTIARAHGGDVSFANRPEGGLRVTISLPK
jgi:signal transduction histidine kinase